MEIKRLGGLCCWCGVFFCFVPAAIFSKNVISESEASHMLCQYGEKIWYFDLYNLLSSDFRVDSFLCCLQNNYKKKAHQISKL